MTNTIQPLPHAEAGGHLHADVGTDAAAGEFIARWQGVTASELSTSQSVLIGLCRNTGDRVGAVAAVIAARFTARGLWMKRLPRLLEMLVVLGRAQEQEEIYVSV